MRDWKAVRLGTKKPVELYDMKSDAGEAKDIASEHPDVVKTFEEFLKTARTDSALWPINENPPKKAGAKQPAADE
jgi:hypothetical protein